MLNETELIQWLLQGDLSINYQVMRDLLGATEPELYEIQSQLPNQGYVQKYLSQRDNETGMWGGGIYQPKWISTHYTLLELKNLCIPSYNKAFIESANLLLESMWYNEGLVRKGRYQDMCVCGMIGSIVCQAQTNNPKLYEIVDYMIDHVQPDGGFNCSWQNSSKSSIHTTLTMLIFIEDYRKKGYLHRLAEVEQLIAPAQEWLLKRELFLKDSDGTPILANVTKIPYPARYKYDILSALDYFALGKYPYDPRMKKALDVLKQKRLKTGAWPRSADYSGLTFFKREKDAVGSRINTLRMLRVLKAYDAFNT